MASFKLENQPYLGDDIPFDFTSIPSPDLLPYMENTLDLKTFENGIMLMSPGPPSRGNFTGDYNFEVSLNCENTNKQKFVYSLKMNRVYLQMMNELPVQFQWDWNKSQGKQLIVRATPIFAGNEHQESRVLRCSIHKQTNDKSNLGVDSSKIPFVLRSVRQSPDVLYCGAEQDETSWLSVAFMSPSSPSTGVNFLQHVYMFCCKHSCISGINRRPIEVLFTLEDLETGDIYGRSSLGVRVCSCPRRDMEKDEEDLRVQSSDAPPTKKRRMTNLHTPALNNLSTEFHSLKALYNTALVTAAVLGPNNSAVPLIETLNKELLRQIKEHDSNVKKHS